MALPAVLIQDRALGTSYLISKTATTGPPEVSSPEGIECSGMPCRTTGRSAAWRQERHFPRVGNLRASMDHPVLITLS